MNGHIKLHRSILDWEWWGDINTFRLFMTILLLANWKDKKWQGRVIKRGQLWTSIPTLAKVSGLTQQQTRTALKHLQSTGEITDRATCRGRLLTVVNYGRYQAQEFTSTDSSTDKLANNQQATNRQLTSTEERKKGKKGRKEEPSILPDGTFDFFADIN